MIIAALVAVKRLLVAMTLMMWMRTTAHLAIVPEPNQKKTAASVDARNRWAFQCTWVHTRREVQFGQVLSSCCNPIQWILLSSRTLTLWSSEGYHVREETEHFMKRYQFPPLIIMCKALSGTLDCIFIVFLSTKSVPESLWEAWQS